MATWDNITHNVRDTLDQLTEGWQELWHKARNAITHFTPSANDQVPVKSTQWGVLSAEMLEGEKDISIAIEAPGMESSDFNVRVEGQMLFISGTRNYSSERKEGHFHITERAYGTFQRALPLPCDVDDTAATASYRRGVLEIRLPKVSAAQPRRITVQS